MNQDHNQSPDDNDKQSSNSGLQQTFDYSMHTQPNDRVANLSGFFEPNIIANDDDLDIQYELEDVSSIANEGIDEEDKENEQQR